MVLLEQADVEDIMNHSSLRQPKPVGHLADAFILFSRDMSFSFAFILFIAYGQCKTVNLTNA